MSSNPTLTAALTYIARGWYVFPIKPGGKTPATTNGVLDATKDAGAVHRTFSREVLGQGRYNIAIATGRSGLVVIDIDGDKGEDAWDTLLERQDRSPATPEALTPGGGRHLLFSDDGRPVRPRTDVFGKGSRVDVRSGESYIVVAPSIHPNGKRYRWAKGRTGGDIAAPSLPEWLRDALEAADDSGNDRVPVSPGTGIITTGQDEYGARQAARLARSGFNIEAAKQALAMMIETQFAGGWEGLDAHNPWTTEDIERWLKGAYDKFYDPDRPDYAADEWAAISDLVPAQAPTAAVATPEVPQGALDLWFEPGDAWAARADDNVPYLVPGILHSGTLAMTVSDPKTGKTWLAFDLMLSVSSGKPFVGHYDIALTGPVYYIATEGVHADSRDRLFAIARGKGLEPADAMKALTFNWRTGAHLDDPKFLAEVLRRAPEYALIVVDVLGEAHGADENSSAEVLAFLRTVKPITNLGPTLLLVHHTNKTADTAGANRIRGSSAWYGAIDDLIQLERSDKDVRTTARMTTRAGASAKPFSFRWPEDTVTADQLVTLEWEAVNDKEAESRKDEDTLLAAIKAEPGVTATGLRSKGVQTVRIRGILDALISKGLIELREEAHYGANGALNMRDSYYLKTDEVTTVPDAENERERLS